MGRGQKKTLVAERLEEDLEKLSDTKARRLIERGNVSLFSLLL